MSEQITIKISGKKAAVEEFIAQQEKIYSLILKTKLLPNDSDFGYHCFLDIDVQSVRKAEARQ